VAPAAADSAAAAAVDEVEATNMIHHAPLRDRLHRYTAAGLIVAAMAIAPATMAQKVYSSPEAAADALVDGIARQDPDAIKVVMGPDYRRYIPMDDVGTDDIYGFLQAWARAHRIVPAGSDKAFLEAGDHGWTLPIPIARAAGGWRFDPKAGAEEMRTRRIGRNELAAMQAAMAYADAQDEYASEDWDGNGTREFASRLLSTPGRRDGLYWGALPGERESPLGGEYANATPSLPYHGYTYRILTAQGKDAPGGAKRYLRDGRMTDGYALIAWPARYGDTGIMTFIVNQDGVVHEKDLGPGTDAAARAVTAYNPDGSWKKAAAR
jgi:hypothetical protein